jgi:cyclic beta-1,2-glucan synthetase
MSRMSAAPGGLQDAPARDVTTALKLLIDPDGAEPIRAEILGSEGLQTAGRRLAAECRLAESARVRSPLLRRFAENKRVLEATIARLIALGDHRAFASSAAEWLIDNFHIIEDALREVRVDFPAGYDEKLPKLASQPLKGYPRVYAIALCLVAHSDSAMDDSRIVSFVAAFQETAPLTIGELWALPTVMRLVLLENLRRLAVKIMWGLDERQMADEWASESHRDVRELFRRSAGDEGSGGKTESPSDPFLARLLQLLRDQDSRGTRLHELEAALARQGTDVNELLRREHSRQAATQVTVGNCILGLRLLSAIDWKSFFEQSSRVERVLRTDPSGMYLQQDFATSDRVRREVERIARGSTADEIEVARTAIEMARAGQLAGEPPSDHVGYYLIDRGAAELKSRFGYRPNWDERLLESVLDNPGPVYFSAIALASMAFLCLFLFGLGNQLFSWWLLPTAAVALLPASAVAVGLVNHLFTLLLKPRSLPKLEFKEGIPEKYSTFIVIPSMLTGPTSAPTLLRRAEMHYLANTLPNIRIGLLTDFADAPLETMPNDQELLQDAIDRVRRLNDHYARGGPDIFYLFHRRRLWNPSQACWMGWERKRGKLLEFNRLLLGARDTTYSVISADSAALPKVRYVITLDADTQMPPETVGKLVGAIAHPLNRPRFDSSQGRVTAGYGVLQPRISFHLNAASHSRFAALLATSGGIDPYSTAASDTFMDLFGLGSFTGKGIYDVAAFAAATDETFPENHVLSHDLIEGNYARCGLLDDVELFDDFPARYHAYARREARWVRGDWQLLPWLLRRVPTAKGWRPNPLPALERWKLFDNLRRSLVPPSVVVLLILGWSILPGSPWFWSAVAIVTLSISVLQTALTWLVQLARGIPLSGILGAPKTHAAIIGQVLLDLAFLAYRAVFLSAAIGRTLVRLLITRRKLLEWETAHSIERRLKGGLSDFFLTMWPGPILALAIAIYLALGNPAALPAALLFITGWLISPAIAFWISRPTPTAAAPLTASEKRALRRLARQTWHFFETFVGDADHWLPPDNFQEVPDPRVAHRTSPTNVGLLVLSTLAAHDLGYLSLPQLIERLEQTFDTLDLLEKHWGHLLNWYDTETLEPLPPRYISTVDSGNFLGCLLTLKQGLLEKLDEPIPSPSATDGLADTILVCNAEGRGPSLTIEPASDDLGEWRNALDRLSRAAAARRATLEASSAHEKDKPASERVVWLDRVDQLVEARISELLAVTPWIASLAAWRNHATKAAGARPGLVADDGTVLESQLCRPLALSTIAARIDAWAAAVEGLAARSDSAALRAIAGQMRDSRAAELVRRIRRLIERADALASGMNFKPLFRPDRHLFAIGLNLEKSRQDIACYDLLASESCLTSFLAVMRGEAQRQHWFQLGRQFVKATGRVGLISWGGSMFEYLMPRLLLKSLPGTLLDQACTTAVARQIEYGTQLGLPWGISESAYNVQASDGAYQYQAFGVPGLGLKQGLADDVVIAPYATVLASMLAPRDAIRNLRRLARAGAEGAYGMYEAIDYTPSRLPRGKHSIILRSYMAHHQGMSLLALVNVLHDDLMPRRFHALPAVGAMDLLLQEQLPPDPMFVDTTPALPPATAEERRGATAPLSRRMRSHITQSPRTNLLSNSRYHVMITSAGAGYSVYEKLDVTRWREDPTCESSGQFFYVRDIGSDLVWSAGFQPICRVPDRYEVDFALDKVAIRRRDGQIETFYEVIVSPDEPAEIRRVTLTNHDSQAHELELTSYAEIVLGPHRDDLTHPAFGKLFLETEWVAGLHALLCRRRLRDPAEEPIWAVHSMALDAGPSGSQREIAIEYETDRLSFLGRGRTPANPAALDAGARLSATTGPVLDPIFSLRTRVRLDPGSSVVVALLTAVAGSRSRALDLADQYRQRAAIDRAFDLAWAHSQAEHRGGISSAEEFHLYQRLATHVLFANKALRGDDSEIAGNRLDQTALWRLGISGDRPIVLVQVATSDQLGLVRGLLAAHRALKLKGLAFDLVLLGLEEAGYYQELARQLREVVRSTGQSAGTDEAPTVFTLQSERVSPEDRTLLQAVARAVFFGDRGSLSQQLDRGARPTANPARFKPTRDRFQWKDRDSAALPADLLFPNGMGGFTPDGREYCILVSDKAVPDNNGAGTTTNTGEPRPRLAPAPWVNVVANSSFGFLVSESGAGYTWSGNSQSNRLTPWSNDAVSDPAGEAIFLRDEESGEAWCPTPLPVGSQGATLVRHGQGYTVFERQTHGLFHELTLFVAPADSIKFYRLNIRNTGSRLRRLSATFYVEWVLGRNRDESAMHVVTRIDPDTGAVFARNGFRTDFADRVAFADVNQRPRAFTCDRLEFLGRHGSVSAPVALTRVTLAQRTGAGLDPCAALQVAFDLRSGEATEVVFVLGEADDVHAARALIRRNFEATSALAILESVKADWDRRLSVISVRTPDPALDLLMNRWLLYQVQSCRVWGRSAFYQSGGAYGFRDQLQDVMALVWSAPEETRAHILRAAGRQFEEGDVQHWWHPPSGRGIRTRVADDPLWLPFVVSHYLEVTGDASILDVQIPYLDGQPLAPGQADDYGLPAASIDAGSLYDHCVRALARVERLGAHGLPLMGHGDWNDGMNRVGIAGKGESVWLAWFSICCLTRFADLAVARGDHDRATQLRRQYAALLAAIDAHAWDGKWYVRAFWDSGTALGSARDTACSIDSIAQSWAVFAEGASLDRARTAMASVDERLVRREDRLILLFAPPFDGDEPDPGYVRGYLPGVRENGGQYTHAAAWCIGAFALLGQGGRACDLLSMINPIRLAENPCGVARYKVEPYVIAGDVYSRPPHVGRGGWTWYTGSAAWIYRVVLQSILGLNRRGDRLCFAPCVPADWPEFHIRYRFGATTYEITIDNHQGVYESALTASLDGQLLPEPAVPLSDDGQIHRVRIGRRNEPDQPSRDGIAVSEPSPSPASEGG